MMHKPIWVRVAVMLVLLVLTSSTTLARPANQGQTGGSAGGDSKPSTQTASRSVLASQQRAALKFWTRERIAQATALSLPVQAQAVAPVANVSEDLAALGTAGSSAPGMPEASADMTAMAAYPEDWEAAAFDAASAMDAVEAPADELAGTKSVYTSYVANNGSSMQTMLPHRWVGRLVLSTSEGTSYCSATAISGNNIVTAAHCVYDTTKNKWYSNWVFAPAYRNGSAPYGVFAASTCTILTSWVNLSGSFSINGWTKYDVAVCTMGKNSAGSTLNQAVGWSGRSWNYPYVRHYHTMGYPWRDYSNKLLSGAGMYLRLCAAESFQQSTDVRGMGCSWGGGISGGPWLVGYAPGVTQGWVDGVNSGIYVGQTNMYGARFTSNNIVPICNARKC